MNFIKSKWKSMKWTKKLLIVFVVLFVIINIPIIMESISNTNKLYNSFNRSVLKSDIIGKWQNEKYPKQYAVFNDNGSSEGYFGTKWELIGGNQIRIDSSKPKENYPYEDLYALFYITVTDDKNTMYIWAYESHEFGRVDIVDELKSPQDTYKAPEFSVEYVDKSGYHTYHRVK